MRRLPLLLVTAVLLAAAYFFWPRPQPSPVIISAEQHSGDAYATAAKKDSTRAAPPDGLIARTKAAARGIESRGPEQLIVFDTIVGNPQLSIIWGGDKIADVMTTVTDSLGAAHPAQMKRIDLSECDDGVAIAGTSVQCNEPRFGHLDIYARGGAAVGVPPPFRLRSDSLASHGLIAIGAAWTRRDKSALSLEAELRTDKTVYVGGRIRLRVW